MRHFTTPRITTQGYFPMSRPITKQELKNINRLQNLLDYWKKNNLINLPSRSYKPKRFNTHQAKKEETALPSVAKTGK